MASCGNRAKAERHRARVRSSTNPMSVEATRS
jgi:predicted RNA-binding Zn ribbon-like protein